MAMLQLEQDLQKLTGAVKLSNALDNVDKIIDQLTKAREQVAAANDPHTTSLTLTKLQNPIKEEFDRLNSKLKGVHKAQNDFNRAQKVAFAKFKGDLPTDQDPMEGHEALINRAIAMHLLREGQFDVASTFIGEAQPHRDRESSPAPHPNSSISPLAVMAREACRARARADEQQRRQSTHGGNDRPTAPDVDDEMIDDADIPASDLMGVQSQSLQTSFAAMYDILTELKAQNLLPAIQWARRNAVELEARGSNLEFELCKLQFIWLFKGPGVNGLPASPPSLNGVSGALEYARQNFGRFQARHLREIQRLSCAMVYAANLPSSPYRAVFDITAAFDEVASSFTREFCSLLGLSAESPLYVAATAGALALPQRVKYTAMTRVKGTEWTTENELAFETPLPRSMMYHSIFVCPVSKEQTTDDNPPVILPCGHVLARESLQCLAKGPRYKCPYCPQEGIVKDAREIIL